MSLSVYVQVVKELLTHGADPNLPLTKGLGSALCIACDLTYEHQRSVDERLALVRVGGGPGEGGGRLGWPWVVGV